MKIIDSIEKTLTSPSLYWQSLSLALCFIASYFFYSLIKENIIPKITSFSNNSNDVTRVFKRYFLPILFPIISICFIVVGFVTYKQFFHEAILFSTTIKLITLFLFLRFIRVSANSTFIANAVGFFLMPALILDIFDIHQTLCIISLIYQRIIHHSFDLTNLPMPHTHLVHLIQHYNLV